jgi:hypothetical protein
MFTGMQGERSGELAGPDVWETCRELIPAGSVFAFLAGHRDALFPARMFADMYPSRNGRPSMPPQVLHVAQENHPARRPAVKPGPACGR